MEGLILKRSGDITASLGRGCALPTSTVLLVRCEFKATRTRASVGARQVLAAESADVPQDPALVNVCKNVRHPRL